MPRKKPETGENSPHSMARPKKTGTASKSRTEGRKKASGRGKRAAEQKAAPAGVLTDGSDAGKHPGGRPTDYRPEFVEIAREMCSQGATDYDLAQELGVTTVTIWRWQARYPEFCNALKVAKGEFDDRVVRSLAQRAVGYTFRATRIFMPKDARAPVYADYDEHVPPDPGAAKIWLCNRRPNEWRDKQIVEHGITSDLAALLTEIDGNGASLI